MKRVMLINPGIRRYGAQEPLNLGFVASYLEKFGVEVAIVDELARQDVRRELTRYKPDVVGITGTTPLATRSYKIAKLCRDMGILTVMGGVHASVLPDEALQYADIVVVGEGEAAMLDIVKDNIQSGIIARPYIRDIDEIPPPARHLMQMSIYAYPEEELILGLSFPPRNMRVASMLTSRGCPYSCTFCHNSWKGLPVRFNSSGRVISEVRDLKERYGIDVINFMEDDFFANRLRAETICRLFIEEKFNLLWYTSTRVSSINEKLLRVAKEAGCRKLLFGFESGSQRILDILNKKTTVEENYRAVELCNRVGIEIDGSFMIGNPTETAEDIEATSKFLEETKIKTVRVLITTPYPGTALWKQCEEHHLIPSEIRWEDLDCNNKVVIPLFRSLPQKELRKLQLRLIGIVLARNSRVQLLSKALRGLVKPEYVILLLKNPVETIRLLWRMMR